VELQRHRPCAARTRSDGAGFLGSIRPRQRRQDDCYEQSSERRTGCDTRAASARAGKGRADRDPRARARNAAALGRRARARARATSSHASGCSPVCPIRRRSAEWPTRRSPLPGASARVDARVILFAHTPARC
jgi:hypothetical protein